MATSAPGGSAPLKPWQRAGAGQSSGPKPWEAGSRSSEPVQTPAQPSRPWDGEGGTQTGGSGGATETAVNRFTTAAPLGSGTWGSGGYSSPYSSYGYGSYGGGFGGPMMNRFGGGGYGGMYGGGMYGQRYGGGMYGGNGYGGGYGQPYDPNDPHGMPQPPPAWQKFLAVVGSVMGVFGKIAFLVDENTQAMHFFITALLQLIDRLGSLYSELVRFVLRLLGWKGGATAKEAQFQGAWQGR